MVFGKFFIELFALFSIITSCGLFILPASNVRCSGVCDFSEYYVHEPVAMLGLQTDLAVLGSLTKYVSICRSAFPFAYPLTNKL